MNPRIERISAEIEKLREKVTSGQARLRELERQKTELENADIISAVRGVDIAPDELAAFVRMFKSQQGGILPELDTAATNGADVSASLNAGQDEDTAESFGTNRHDADKNQNDKEDE